MWQFVLNISNSAVTNLLYFLKRFVGVVGHAFRCNAMQDMSDSIPLTLQSLHSLLSMQSDDVISYVVCPNCDSVYEYQSCFELSRSGTKKSKVCSHIPYLNHPQESRRKPCGAVLLKKVKVKYEYNLCPIRSYAYKPLKATITQLARRKGFLHCCELWRGRSVPPDFVCDIYDGLFWKAFNLSENKNFLSLPHCFLLTLNVDWFEPFERGV